MLTGTVATIWLSVALSSVSGTRWSVTNGLDPKFTPVTVTDAPPASVTALVTASGLS